MAYIEHFKLWPGDKFTATLRHGLHAGRTVGPFVFRNRTGVSVNGDNGLDGKDCIERTFNNIDWEIKKKDMQDGTEEEDMAATPD